MDGLRAQRRFRIDDRLPGIVVDFDRRRQVLRMVPVFPQHARYGLADEVHGFGGEDGIAHEVRNLRGPLPDGGKGRRQVRARDATADAEEPRARVRASDDAKMKGSREDDVLHERRLTLDKGPRVRHAVRGLASR